MLRRLIGIAMVLDECDVQDPALWLGRNYVAVRHACWYI